MVHLQDNLASVQGIFQSYFVTHVKTVFAFERGKALKAVWGSL